MHCRYTAIWSNAIAIRPPVRFANGSARVLVATDVAARGLDIKSLELVVNFELAWDP